MIQVFLAARQRVVAPDMPGFGKRGAGLGWACQALRVSHHAGLFASGIRRNPSPTVQDRQPLNRGKVAVMCHEGGGTHVERGGQLCGVG